LKDTNKNGQDDEEEMAAKDTDNKQEPKKDTSGTENEEVHVDRWILRLTRRRPSVKKTRNLSRRLRILTQMAVVTLVLHSVLMTLFTNLRSRDRRRNSTMQF